jgi:hypothetical protein
MLEAIKGTMQYIVALLLCTLIGAIPFYSMYILGVLK